MSHESLTEELSELYERNELLAALEEACWDGRVAVDDLGVYFLLPDRNTIFAYYSRNGFTAPRGGTAKAVVLKPLKGGDV